jgi:hypothetical protein
MILHHYVKQCKYKTLWKKWFLLKEGRSHNVFDDRPIKWPVVEKNHQNMHPQSQSELAATNAPVGCPIHWMATFFHSAWDGVHHNPFLFTANHCNFFLGLFGCIFPGSDLTHGYPIHLPNVISIVPTLVSY